MYLSWKILIAALISTTVAGVIPTSDGTHLNEESDLITSSQQDLVTQGAAPTNEEVTKLAVATALVERSIDVIVRDPDGSGMTNITMELLDNRSLDWMWNISGLSRRMIFCVSTLPLFEPQQMQSGMAG
ncbi:hypothetical protein GCG54_00014421 [Colletotrichum gloeosporioides]|uniref:Uncharacterized protein n=1 Tax=Colletotrichum gloeosporioides TaxID=474922 RepID=A0A8H4CWY1_COLGL|nr:uncharacterized protein GCG54_00014421 [Colletotrichum gloeosporioides]KAF3811675.1 hypothetical protein GCG54_00014421 [Colletotrichum gloeosporioides]